MHGQQQQHQPAHSGAPPPPRDPHRYGGTAHLLAEAMDKAAVSEADGAGGGGGGQQNPAVCKACKKEASFMCSACRGAHYCSLECQVSTRPDIKSQST